MEKFNNNAIIEEINDLKKKKNAVILAHSYQNIEIDYIADFKGDSLYLSKRASETDAKIVVFAGVYFMAETAKILSPDKKILIPDKNAGCEMADMLSLYQIKEFKRKHPNIPVVCYINSSAEVKAEADICATSANAIDVVKSLNSKKVLFVPDMNLGGYVNSKLPDIDVISYNGFCPIHNNISIDDIKNTKELHKNAEVLIHPECTKDVLDMGDFIGSTSAIMNYVENSNKNDFIIVTEIGVVERLQRKYPSKNFYLISKKAICKNMKKCTLENILLTLKNEEYEVKVKKDVAQKAYKSIERMISI